MSIPLLFKKIRFYPVLFPLILFLFSGGAASAAEEYDNSGDLIVPLGCVPQLDYLRRPCGCPPPQTNFPVCEKAPAPAPKPVPAPVAEPVPAPSPQDEKFSQDIQAIGQKLGEVINAGRSLETWQREFSALEKSVKVSGAAESLKKLEGLRMKAREARAKRLFRPLSGPIKFRDVLKNPARFFRPWLQGEIFDERLSVNGYPNANYLSGFKTSSAKNFILEPSERFEIRQGTDGNFYLINLDRDNSSAIFEGFGVQKGRVNFLPPIRLAGVAGGNGVGGAVSGNYTGEITGAESWADTKVATVIDPATGGPSLVAQFDVKKEEAQTQTGTTPISDEKGQKQEPVISGTIPVGPQEIALNIKKDGETIKRIPLMADVQEFKPSNPVINFLSIPWLVFAIVAIFTAVAVVRIFE